MHLVLLNYFSISMIDQFYPGIIERFRNLGRWKGKAPNKPVLVLSLIDCIEAGLSSSKRIPIDQRLFDSYQQNWELLVGSDSKSRIEYPLFYLKNDDLGWKMITRPGEEVKEELSKSRIQKDVAYGIFDDPIWEFLQSKENRDLARVIVLSNYFPETQHKYLDDRPFEEIRKLTLDFFEESPAPYRVRETKQEGYVRSELFRARILHLYNNACAISRLQIDPPVRIIQACHILSFAESGMNVMKNGIALCANLHAAFDAGFLSINESYEVIIPPKKVFNENVSPYSLGKLKGSKIILPDKEQFWPSQEYLGQHRKRWGFKQ